MANIVTILLGFSISAAMTGEKFVNLGTLAIIGMGLIAFVLDTAGGVITAKIFNLFLPKDKKVNPMVGAAGISAFPMSARGQYSASDRRPTRATTSSCTP